MNEQTAEKPKKKIWPWIVGILGGVILLAMLGWLFLFQINHFSLNLLLRGESTVVLNYGEQYLDAGADIRFQGTLILKDGTVPDVTVQRSGLVDTNRVGIYTVTYSAEYLGWKASAVRTVQVVDRIEPEIVLTSDPNHVTIYGEAYEEEGFRAYDEYDGDITDWVEWEEKDGIVTYRVSDSSGNRATATRTIVYDDPTPPEIVLVDGEEISITAGTPYQEPGFTATDNLDGDLTAAVTVTGEVDHYLSGSYTIEYSVTDSFENTTTVIRTVNVVPKQQPQQVTPDGKVIYLTFDDGPGAYTKELLAVLKAYNVKATFFVVDTGNYSAMKQIVEEGHSIGIHSMTHTYREVYASTEAFFADLYGMQQIIYEQTGVRTTLMRFPGGSSNTVSSFNKGIMTKLTKAVQDAGFQYFDWNVDSMDAGGAKDADEVFQNVVNGVSGKRISIVLQHDIKGFSVDAVERIISWGLANGYTFLPLDPTSPGAHHGINN